MKLTSDQWKELEAAAWARMLMAQGDLLALPDDASTIYRHKHIKTAWLEVYEVEQYCSEGDDWELELPLDAWIQLEIAAWAHYMMRYDEYMADQTPDRFRVNANAARAWRATNDESRKAFENRNVRA